MAILDKYTDEYVLGEVRKLQYTYGLNKVIRYNLERLEKFQTQSVAEHLTNIVKFLNDNNFQYIKKFLEVINKQKESYGILRI